MVIGEIEPGDFLSSEIGSTSEYSQMYHDLARIRRASITNARESSGQYEEQFWGSLGYYAGATAETLLTVESLLETEQNPKLLERRHRDNLIRMNNFALKVDDRWVPEYKNRVGDTIEPFYEGEGPNRDTTAEMIQRVDEISEEAFKEASELPNGGIGEEGDFEEHGNATVDPLEPRKFSSTPEYDVHQDYFWREKFGIDMFHQGLSNR